MPGSFSPAEIALAATVVEQELADLQGATDYHSAAGWEYLQDYPRDRFDLLFRLALDTRNAQRTVPARWIDTRARQI